MANTKAVNNFLDLIFPERCSSCQKIGSVFCPDCYNQIKIIQEQKCPHCEKVISHQGKTCSRCQNKKDHHLDGLTAASPYQDPLKTVIYHFKYNLIKKLAEPLSQILFHNFQKNNLDLPDLLIPVPLHPIKERLRGFNQSQFLAQKLSQKIAPGMEISICQDLKRKRFTFSQKRLTTYQERQQNIQRAFILEKSNSIKKKNILLIDDVATTGATLFECARILKNSGAQKVSALVLARQQC